MTSTRRTYRYIGLGALVKLLLLTIYLLLNSQTAFAGKKTMTSQVTFLTDFVVTEVNPLQFGLLDYSMANNTTITIDTNDVATGATTNIVGGSQKAAEIALDSIPNQSINIEVDNIVSGTYYTLKDPMCSYESSTEAACDKHGEDYTSVANGTIKIGFTLRKNNHTASPPAADNGSFDVIITYN